MLRCCPAQGCLFADNPLGGCETWRKGFREVSWFAFSFPEALECCAQTALRGSPQNWYGFVSSFFQYGSKLAYSDLQILRVIFPLAKDRKSTSKIVVASSPNLTGPVCGFWPSELCDRTGFLFL